MNLAPRQTAHPHRPAIGRTVIARPPTVRVPIHGTVVEVDGYTVSLMTARRELVAVDIEDCHPHD